MRGVTNKAQDKKPYEKTQEDNVIKCHNCQGINQYSRDCKATVRKVEYQAYYLAKMEEAKQNEINKAFLARDGPPMVKIWKSDDDDEEEVQQNANYFCFMALGEEEVPDHSEVFNFTSADGSKPSPLHQQVIEKVCNVPKITINLNFLI